MDEERLVVNVLADGVAVLNSPLVGCTPRHGPMTGPMGRAERGWRGRDADGRAATSGGRSSVFDITLTEVPTVPRFTKRYIIL